MVSHYTDFTTTSTAKSLLCNTSAPEMAAPRDSSLHPQWCLLVLAQPGTGLIPNQNGPQDQALPHHTLLMEPSYDTRRQKLAWFIFPPSVRQICYKTQVARKYVCFLTYCTKTLLIGIHFDNRNKNEPMLSYPEPSFSAFLTGL